MLLSIREASPESVMAMYAAHAQETFGTWSEGDFTPVIIASRNGADDLPATLTSLSLSREPVLPIVVDNRSDDDTSRVARAFGACTLDAHEGSKMAAVQTGLNYAASLGKSEVLLTDDDTLFPRGWSGRMIQELRRHNVGQGVGVFATSLTMHGKSPIVDAAYTAYRAGRDIYRGIKGLDFSARGHNYGIGFDSEGQMLAAINEIDPAIFEGDAHAVLHAIKATGGTVRPLMDPRAVVVTRGDRVSTLKEAVKSIVGDAKHHSYRSQYGEEYTVYAH